MKHDCNSYILLYKFISVFEAMFRMKLEFLGYYISKDVEYDIEHYMNGIHELVSFDILEIGSVLEKELDIDLNVIMDEFHEQCKFLS